MPETENPQVETTEKPKSLSVGKPEFTKPTPPSNVVDQIQNNNNVDANTTEIVNNGASEQVAPAPTTPAITDAQLADYFKSQGINYEGLDKLKEKINYVAPKELSEEEKLKQAADKEKRLVDLAVSGGITVDQYVALKNLADSDPKELSLNTIKAELKEAGFTKDQIDEVIKERYYQIQDEDLEQFEDESDKEFAKRKREYGSKKLENHSLHIKKQAQDYFTNLNKELESEDLGKQEEAKISSNIDEHFSKVPLKSTFEIGEINGKPIPPIEAEVTEKDYAEVKEMLKNPTKRNNFLFNKEGGLNLSSIANVLSENIMLKSAIKAAYHVSGSRQVDIFRKVFPAVTAQELGVGGVPIQTSTKGQAASFGKSVKTKPSSQHN